LAGRFATLWLTVVTAAAPLTGCDPEPVVRPCTIAAVTASASVAGITREDEAPRRPRRKSPPV